LNIEPFKLRKLFLMLQRIQTIWLFLAGAAALATLKLPYYSGTQDVAVPYHELNGITGGILIMMVTITIGVVAFVNIALYKNRTTQLRLCVAGIVLEALLLFLYYRQVSMFTQGTFALSSILHMLIVLFFVLAARGINKDEKLIKESDRLR
jgi:Ca2+/Na+ antiporter